MASILAKACAGLAVGLVCAIIGEVALRAVGFNAPLWYLPDERLGWALRPGAEGWFTREGRAYAQVSSAGFRDRPHALEKPKGTYRIAVLGDSVVEAFQVDIEAAFWRRLERELRGCHGLRDLKLEVMAFGVSGYGTAQQYLLLQSSVIRYQPDLVLLAFAPNDLRNNSRKLEPQNERPFYLLDGDGLRLDDSFTRRAPFSSRVSRLYETFRSAFGSVRLVQLVEAARRGLDTWRKAGAAHAQAEQAGGNIRGIEPTTPAQLFAPPRNADWEEAWTVTERLIARMNAFAERHGARFAVTVISHSAQVHPDSAVRKNVHDALGVPDLFYLERRMQALGERSRFPVVALAPELQRLADGAKIYFHGFRNYGVGWDHWNEEGHRAAAAILAPRVCAAL